MADEYVQRLLIEVANQWLTNHAEHCGIEPAWPHSGVCHWPLPAVLAELPTNEVGELLQKAFHLCTTDS